MATPTAAKYPQWESNLLTSTGVTPNTVNLQFLNLWAQSEGTPANGNNPLAITDPSNSYPHSGVIASNGGNPVYAFPTEAIGVQATASFLQHGYQSIISAMATGNLTDMFNAVNASGWCRGCQGGHYPTTVYNALNGQAPSGIFRGGANVAGGQQNPQGQSNYGCNNGSKGLDIFGVHLGTSCTLKALSGGLLIGAGGGVLLVGAVLIAAYGLSHTSAGRAVTGAASRGPIAAGAGFVASQSRQARRDRTNEAEAASQEPYRVRQTRYRSEGFSQQGSSAPTPGKVRQMRRAA